MFSMPIEPEAGFDGVALYSQDQLDAALTTMNARIRELQQWKQVVIDGLMVAEIYRDAHESDPKAALNALIDWNVSVATRIKLPVAGWADEWRQLREYTHGDQSKKLPKEQFRLLIESASMHMEDQADYAAILEQDIHELHDKITAHEKVCAGVWVDVKERPPEEHRWFPGLYPGGFIVDTQFREGNYYRYGDAEPTSAITHWLDAKEPR
jgi:hypothetical protein